MYSESVVLKSNERGDVHGSRKSASSMSRYLPNKRVRGWAPNSQPWKDWFSSVTSGPASGAQDVYPSLLASQISTLLN
jgi:hypothetical protein